MSDIDPGIAELFAELEKGYSEFDFAAVRTLWSPALRAPLYLAEEQTDFCTSWSALEAYWQSLPRTLSRLRAQFRPRVQVPLSPTQSWVGFDLTWLAQSGEAPAIAGHVRGVALCALEDGRWRVQAWIEAPLAPIMYVRELYRLFARTLEPAGGSAADPD